MFGILGHGHEDVDHNGRPRVRETENVISMSKTDGNVTVVVQITERIPAGETAELDSVTTAGLAAAFVNEILATEDDEPAEKAVNRADDEMGDPEDA